jgi:hypothetical protein
VIDSSLNDKDVLGEFRGYLDRAEEKKGLLPAWWGKEKREVCERMAVDRGNWECISGKVEKGDVNDYYGIALMAMQLRMVAETVEGTNVMALGG